MASESSIADNASPQSNTHVPRPPDEQNPPGSNASLDDTLLRIDKNMGSMTQLLTRLCATLPPRADTVNNEGDSLNANATSRKQARSPSVSKKEGDKLSVHAAISDDDVDQIMGEIKNPAVGETDTSPSENPVTGEHVEELEILKELGAATQDDKKRGPKIKQQLAETGKKRWGCKIGQERLSSMLDKHPLPENCIAIGVPRVNPEIWDQVNVYRRKADPRLSNIQQIFQRASATVLTLCDKVIAPAREDRKIHDDDIDTPAFLGHACYELSVFRREQIKPALKKKNTMLFVEKINLFPYTPIRRWPGQTGQGCKRKYKVERNNGLYESCK